MDENGLKCIDCISEVPDIRYSANYCSVLLIKYLYPQHFKAKSINKKPTYTWCLFPCSHSTCYLTPMTIDNLSLKSLFAAHLSRYTIVPAQV